MQCLAVTNARKEVLTYQDTGFWKISLLLLYQAVHWHRMMILNYSNTEHEPGEEEEIYNAGEGEEEASHRAREGVRGTELRTSLHIGRLYSSPAWPLTTSSNSLLPEQSPSQIVFGQGILYTTVCIMTYCCALCLVSVSTIPILKKQLESKMKSYVQGCYSRYSVL